MDCSTPGFPVHHQLLEPTQTHVHHVGDAITILSSVIPFSSHLQSFPASGSFQMSQLFTSGGQTIGSFSFTISPSNEYSGLISFRMDWLDLFAVQETLKSLLQHHSSKASVLQCSAFLIVQFSHPYMTTGKTIALTRWTFVGKVICLLFNMLSRLVIAFLTRSKHLLISWLQSLFAVILEPKKRKSVTVFIVYPSICHEVMGLDAMILVFWMLSFKPTFFQLAQCFRKVQIFFFCILKSAFEKFIVLYIDVYLHYCLSLSNIMLCVCIYNICLLVHLYLLVDI